ncbi:LysM domain-containing protein [Kingella negevensis]|uniref:LysM peptidoglycan-binding domain-containing protein n=1 Tax=Kingella negevensis TaxID=1522312 RepID=UPI002543E4CA|nr:LysM domain-containing protein [Kingella negevensis]WII92701.1 LysM domain-containing protein [Kingella negevensis]
MKKPIITLLCATSMIISSNTAIAETLRIKQNAPARYTVKEGDTLWSISGKYLYRPWKWPVLWNMNRREIANPNRIYPGDVLALSYVNGRPVLRTDRSRTGGIPTIKLRPRVRDMGSGYAIPAINADFYRMFMKTPFFMTNEDLSKAARLVSGSDNRLYYSDGDRVYADGATEPGTYMVFRLSRSLKDPHTKANLGQLVEYAGEASTLATPNSALSHRTSEAQQAFAQEANKGIFGKKDQTLADDEYYVKSPTNGKPVVTRTAQPMMINGALSEIRKGDYLFKRPENFDEFNYVPHEPAGRVDASIVDIMDGVSESGTMQTIILNKGKADGLDDGTVLSIYRRGQLINSDYKGNSKETRYVTTPNQEIGLAMVYRTGEHVSSAIILESVTNVNREDLISNPGQDLDTFGERPSAAWKDPKDAK